MIFTREDLGMLEKHLSVEENEAVVVDALAVIGILGSGPIKRAASIDLIEALYAATSSGRLMAKAVETLARLNTYHAKGFLLAEAEHLPAEQLASIFKIWRDQIEVWPDLDEWRSRLIEVMARTVQRPSSHVFYIDEKGQERDCRYWVLKPLATFAKDQAPALLRALIEHDDVLPETRVEAIGCHWLITQSHDYVDTVRAAQVSSVAKDWLYEIELAKSPKVVVTDYDAGARQAKGFFRRAPELNQTFEVYFDDVPTRCYRDTSMVEIYIHTEGVLEWSWTGSESSEVIAWVYGRQLVSDLIESMDAALAAYCSDAP